MSIYFHYETVFIKHLHLTVEFLDAQQCTVLEFLVHIHNYTLQGLLLLHLRSCMQHGLHNLLNPLFIFSCFF